MVFHSEYRELSDPLISLGICMIDLTRNFMLYVVGLSRLFAFCYDLTLYNFTFLLYLKADDSDCEANIIVVLDSVGEDLAFAL